MTQDEPPRLDQPKSSRHSSTSRKYFSIFSRLFDSTLDVRLPDDPAVVYELVLSNIRLVCIVAMFVAASLGSPRPTAAVYAALSVWAVYSVGLLIAIRLGASFHQSRVLLIHIGDIAAAALVIFLVNGTGIPLFVAVGFVMFAAGYRWGVRETIWTGIASALLVSGNAVLTLTSNTPTGGINTPFTLETFFVQLSYVVLLTVMIGYFAEQRRVSRTELAMTAAAAERARLARELHDGIIQSLLGIKLRFDVLRLSGSLGPSMLEELRQYEALLAREIVNLRMLTFELAPSDDRPAALTIELRDLVDRFEHASGMTARFVAAGDVDHPSAHAHHEIARIVQESLLNVHRHSGARQVLVRLAEKDDHWELSVEDDGRGFDFEGRVTQDELDRIGRGPRIIKERVRLLGGSLTIESNAGTGAKLTITLPLKV
jgi:signal transduction histidine kinase